MNKKIQEQKKIKNIKNVLKGDEDEVFQHENHENIINRISKKFGESSISTLEKEYSEGGNFLDSGSHLLNKIIGTPGYPFGKIVEIFGEESAGKTTLALHSVLECQKAGKVAVYMDLENALNTRYIEEIGIDKKKLLICTPSNGEEAFDMIKELTSLDEVGLIVIDSVATMIPKAELEGDVSNQLVGLHARLMSKGLKIINSSSNRKSVIIFINQIRQKINTFSSFGNPETTTGGIALKFIASIKIKLKRIGRIEKDGKIIGIETQAKIIKNKISSPYGEARLEIMFSGGIQKEREILNIAIEKEIIKKSGSWYSYEDLKIGNGKENVISFFKKNNKLFLEIEKKVLESFSL